VPSADKRQRKKENARAAREAREAAARRRKRTRTIITVASVVVAFVALILIVNAVTGGSSKKKAGATSSSTTAASGVKCTTTKPAQSTKPTNLKAPAMSINPAKTYTATISTSCGDIKVALDAKHSPKGVNNFVSLARKGFYDGLTWHRVVKNFVIQGGDPKGDGSGGPGYDVVTELPANGYPDGTLAWAKTSSAPAGSAGSQFFVVTGDPAALDQKQNGSYQYGAFGTVTSGMDVAKKIESFAPADPNGGPPSQPVYVNKVTITES
jgi:peptidyl-prolyl cis-trans isomerase B (cyclophilin B)